MKKSAKSFANKVLGKKSSPQKGMISKMKKGLRDRLYGLQGKG